MKAKFFYVLALSIGLIACNKEQEENNDPDNGTIKLSGVYLTYEGGSSNVWYLMSAGNRVMRQRTAHLGTGFTLQELINEKEVYFEDHYSPEHPTANVTSKQRLRMVYYDMGSNTKLFWRVHTGAGVWHLGLKEIRGGFTKEMLQDPTYWFKFHLYSDDYYEEGQTAVAIESVAQPGQFVENEGHYSTGTNYIRLMERGNPDHATRFYVTNP
jgi:hypothetical protein